MLVVLGTSLKVHGVKRVVKEFARAVHSLPTTRIRPEGGKGRVVFVNKTAPPGAEWEGVFDYWVKGECDDWVASVEEDWKRIKKSDWQTQQTFDGTAVTKNRPDIATKLQSQILAETPPFQPAALVDGPAPVDCLPGRSPVDLPDNGALARSQLPVRGFGLVTFRTPLEVKDEVWAVGERLSAGNKTFHDKKRRRFIRTQTQDGSELWDDVEAWVAQERDKVSDQAKSTRKQLQHLVLLADSVFGIAIIDPKGVSPRVDNGPAQIGRVLNGAHGTIIILDP